MTKLILASATLLALFASATVMAQGVTPQCIEGVYTLEEFKRDGQVFTLPQISGRLVIPNGVVIWIFHDHTQQSAETNYAGFGRYTVNATSFAYRYDDMSAYTHSGTGISVSTQLPWAGMRLFTPVTEQDGVHFRNADTRTDYFCSADELLYTFGTNYRKHRRIKSE
jgi:hypothetical protein